MIDAQTEQQIKDAADIVDIIADFVELRKSGVAEYVGLCPFHDDRHLGSFKVNRAKKMCYCFSCGKGGDALYFLTHKSYAPLSYGDALRWIAHKYGISVEGGAEGLPPVRKIERISRAKPKMLTLSNELARATVQDTSSDTLSNWLRSLPWNAAQRARVEAVLRIYGVGHWIDGRVIFWQVDEQGRIRSGKLMRYGAGGKRVRSENPGWMHNQPEAKADLEECAFSPCMFGQHLLKRYQRATVNIVESEKTAIIMAIAYGGIESNVWLACGGEQWLRKTIQPIIDGRRDIMLWPDKDGEERWKKIAETINNSRVHVYTEWMNNEWIEEDGPKADIADIIIRKIKKNEPKQ